MLAGPEAGTELRGPAPVAAEASVVDLFFLSLGQDLAARPAGDGGRTPGSSAAWQAPVGVAGVGALSGPAPTSGDTFDFIRTFASRSGDFATAPAGFSWDKDFLGTLVPVVP
jgi:hypothetical protein